MCTETLAALYFFCALAPMNAICCCHIAHIYVQLGNLIVLGKVQSDPVLRYGGL